MANAGEYYKNSNTIQFQFTTDLKLAAIAYIVGNTEYMWYSTVPYGVVGNRI